jgi:hypothetical protein
VEQETRKTLADELAALLSEVDAAISARCAESRGLERRREDTTRLRTPPGRTLARLRWLTGFLSRRARRTEQ